MARLREALSAVSTRAQRGHDAAFMKTHAESMGRMQPCNGQMKRFFRAVELAPVDVCGAERLAATSTYWMRHSYIYTLWRGAHLYAVKQNAGHAPRSTPPPGM